VDCSFGSESKGIKVKKCLEVRSPSFKGELMNCRKCGAEADPLLGTCIYCGAYLRDSLSESYSNFLKEFLRHQTRLAERSSDNDHPTAQKHKKVQAANALELYLPNDIENLVELALSAKSQALSFSRGGFWTAIHGMEVSNAWLSKLEQVTEKLRLSAREDESLRSLINTLEDSAAEAKKNLARSKLAINLFTICFFLLPLLLFGGAQIAD
jgi:hypothetical protein